MRNISFAMTTPQLLAGTKDVTRRLGWVDVRPGQLLRAIEKGQGLKKGEQVVALALILVVSARLERLDRLITEPDYGVEEVRREGFPKMSQVEFINFFCSSHTGCFPEREITRIEFKKLPLVREVFQLHMRHQHGATYGQNLLDESNSVIGARSSFTPRAKYRDKHPAREVFTLFGVDGGESVEFDNAVDFLVAYQNRLDARRAAA